MARVLKEPAVPSSTLEDRRQVSSVEADSRNFILAKCSSLLINLKNSSEKTKTISIGSKKLMSKHLDFKVFSKQV